MKTLTKLNNKYLSTVFKGVIDGKTVRQIHKDIKKITEYQNTHNLPYDKKQEIYSSKLALKAVTGTRVMMDTFKDSPDITLVIADFLFNLFKKEDSFQKMKKISFENGREFEGTEKGNTLVDYITGNQTGQDDELKSKIFYLASSHNDCADDHKDWQGKMYYDKYWRKYVKNEYIRKQVEEYIKREKCKTIQWVTNRPVWFITRPHCRHYFKDLPIEEVLNKEIKTLIANYKMHSKIGNRPTQTISHSTKKEWYTKENIEGIIEKYEERLAYHESLYAVKKTQIIKNAIEKDKMLIKKWKKYLQHKVD